MIVDLDSDLNQLFDVNNPIALADDQCLVYNETTNKWENATCPGGGTSSGGSYTSGTPESIQVDNDLNTISQNWDGNINYEFSLRVPWEDENVANDITLDNITQITNRSYVDLQDLPVIPTDTTLDTNTMASDNWLSEDRAFAKDLNVGEELNLPNQGSKVLIGTTDDNASLPYTLGVLSPGNSIAFFIDTWAINSPAMIMTFFDELNQGKVFQGRVNGDTLARASFELNGLFMGPGDGARDAGIKRTGASTIALTTTASATEALTCDASQNCDIPNGSLEINGTTVINSSRRGEFTDMNASDDVTIGDDLRVKGNINVDGNVYSGRIGGMHLSVTDDFRNGTSLLGTSSLANVYIAAFGNARWVQWVEGGAQDDIATTYMTLPPDYKPGGKIWVRAGIDALGTGEYFEVSLTLRDVDGVQQKQLIKEVEQELSTTMESYIWEADANVSFANEGDWVYLVVDKGSSSVSNNHIRLWSIALEYEAIS
ncbi:MAG: hypothetical protein ACOC2M_00520 [bacterium]